LCGRSKKTWINNIRNVSRLRKTENKKDSISA
jgi:hypothetical protein